LPFIVIWRGGTRLKFRREVTSFDLKNYTLQLLRICQL
jgi:hypothetical protein